MLLKKCLFTALFGASVTFGCSFQQPSNISFIEYPSFFSQRDEYQTLVVGPIENVIEPDKYTHLVASNLVVKMRQNGAYKIIDATKDKMDEAALREKGRKADPNALVLTGTIINYGEISSTQVDSVGITSQSASVSAGERYSANSNGTQRYGAYTSGRVSRKEINVPVLNFSKAMYAKLNVNLTRVSDGEVIANDTVFAIASESSMFGLNMSDKEDRLKRALDDLTTNAVYYLAPSVETLTVDPNEVLLVQTYGFVMGEEGWKKATKFSQDETIRVVFTISPRTALNDFELVLKADKVQEPIAVYQINYSGVDVVYEYKASELVEATGKNSFNVQLVYNNKVLSKQSFDVKK